MAISAKINPCLCFGGQAEDAAKFYTSIFKNSKIVHVQHYFDTGKEIHGMKPGSVLLVVFELDGIPFTAINGPPHFKFSEALSLMVNCDTQEEVDHFWEKLGEGGDPAKQQCGWLGDKFGVSWQVAPKALSDMVADPDRVKAERVFGAMVGMKKIIIADLKKAYNNV